MRQKTKTRKLSCMDPITVFNVRVVSRKSKAVFFVICRFASFFLGSIFRFTETAKPENRSHFFLSCFSFPVPYTSKAYIHVRKGNPDNGQPYATADSSTQHQRGAARDTAPATAATVLVAQGTALCKTAVGGCYLQSFRGKRPIDYPAQGNPYNTLSPSERRDIFGVGTVYGCTLTYPIRFNTWGTREICVFRDRTRKRFYNRNVRSQIRTPCPRRRQMWRYYLLSYRGERSIDYPVQSPG